MKSVLTVALVSIGVVLTLVALFLAIRSAYVSPTTASYATVATTALAVVTFALASPLAKKPFVDIDVESTQIEPAATSESGSETGMCLQSRLRNVGDSLHDIKIVAPYVPSGGKIEIFRYSSHSEQTAIQHFEKGSEAFIEVTPYTPNFEFDFSATARTQAGKTKIKFSVRCNPVRLTVV